MKSAAMNGPTAIDLFSGCGGMTVGLKRAGFRVVGAVEIDPFAAEAYQLNHPDVELWNADVRTLTGVRMNRRLRMRRGELDLLAGCPPCQGFSRLRTLNGGSSADDARNDLVLDFLRLADQLRPRTIMMENVPGLAADYRFGLLVSGLRTLGYIPEYKVLDAADYAVPQRRRRLILLAGTGNAIPFAAKARTRRTVRSAIGGMVPAGTSGDEAHDFPERRSARVRGLISAVPKDGGSRTDLPDTYTLGCHERCDGFYDVYGRMAWDDVAPTITSGCVNPSKGRFLHPEQDRTVTVREAAILQTFPPRYVLPATRGKYPLAELIGNAIPPEFIRRHALRIARHLATHRG